MNLVKNMYVAGSRRWKQHYDYYFIKFIYILTVLFRWKKVVHRI